MNERISQSHVVVDDSGGRILYGTTKTSKNGRVFRQTSRPVRLGKEEDRIQFIGTLEELGRNYILQTLEDAKGDKRAAAGILGISLKTLYNKLRKHGLIVAGDRVPEVDSYSI